MVHFDSFDGGTASEQTADIAVSSAIFRNINWTHLQLSLAIYMNCVSISVNRWCLITGQKQLYLPVVGTDFEVLAASPSSELVQLVPVVATERLQLQLPESEQG